MQKITRGTRFSCNLLCFVIRRNVFSHFQGSLERVRARLFVNSVRALEFLLFSLLFPRSVLFASLLLIFMSKLLGSPNTSRLYGLWMNFDGVFFKIFPFLLKNFLFEDKFCHKISWKSYEAWSHFIICERYVLNIVYNNMTMLSEITNVTREIVFR